MNDYLSKLIHNTFQDVFFQEKWIFQEKAAFKGSALLQVR